MSRMFNAAEIATAMPLPGYPLQLPDMFQYVANADRAEKSDTIVRKSLQTRYAAAGLRADDITDACVKFLQAWDVFKAMHYNDYVRLCEAEAADYDMLYNYDKTISGSVSTDFDGGETPKGYAIETSLVHGETITIHDGTYKETDSTAPYDGSVIETHTTERGHKTADDNNTHEHTGTDTNTVDKGVQVQTTDMREYGNIGVQTVADILLKEITLRSESLVQAYLDCFVREYLVTCWGGEGEY